MASIFAVCVGLSCVAAGIASAGPKIEFSLGYSYFDAGTRLLTFNDGWITRVDGAYDDALYMACPDVVIPDLTVGGNSTDGWTVSGGTIQIVQWDDPSTVYLSGILGEGDLVLTGDPYNEYIAYTAFQTDIIVTDIFNPIESAILTEIDADRRLDFSLGYVDYVAKKKIVKKTEPLSPISFEDMLGEDSGMYEVYGPEGGTLSSIPAPGALVLCGGGLLFGSVGANLRKWRNRRRGS